MLIKNERISKMADVSKYIINYTQMAKAGQLTPLVGRQDEVNRLMHILLRKNNNNPLVMGPSGIGKTALIEGLIQFMASESAPDTFKDVEVVGVDVASVMLDTTSDDAYAAILKQIYEYIYAAHGKKIFYAKDVSLIVRTDINPENIEPAKFLKLKIMEMFMI